MESTKEEETINELKAALAELESEEGLEMFVEGHGLQSRYFAFSWQSDGLEIEYSLPYARVLSDEGEQKLDAARIGAAIRLAILLLASSSGGALLHDGETKDLGPICDLVDADPSARHVFLVTHGPFTTFPANAHSFRWRLGGDRKCEASRPRLYETLSRRRAVVLSGHTHTTCFYRHENKFGGFAEFTVNSVWKAPELATATPERSGAADYRAAPEPGLSKGRVDDLRAEVEFFRPGVREYFFGNGAGHYRLDVSGGNVALSFYPGDARAPARRFEFFPFSI